MDVGLALDHWCVRSVCCVDRSNYMGQQLFALPRSIPALGKVFLTVAHAVPCQGVGANAVASLFNVSFLVGRGCGAGGLTWRQRENRHEVFWRASHVFDFGFGLSYWVGNFLQRLQDSLAV